VSDDELPPFKTQDMVQVRLADPNQIMLVHTILKEFFPPMIDPPFKIQYKKNSDDQWRDINFIDQIKIAAVMFTMKRKKSIMEQRLVQNHQLLISIAIEHDMFKFGVKTISNGESIPSRLVVTDGTFDFA
jgi:hypothetical protein